MQVPVPVAGSVNCARVKCVAITSDDGHEIGIHTWDHKSLPRMSAAAISSEISTTSDAIVRAGAPRPTLFRPPYGATNAIVASVAGRLGVAQILWSVDTLDWKDRNSATVTSSVLNSVRPGSIVLMHDIHPTTVAAAPAILDGLQARGYTLVTVTDLLGMPQPGRSYSSR